MTPKRGEIWLINMNPGYKSVPGKVRPALVMQNDNIRDIGSYIIIPLTSKHNPEASSLLHIVSARGDLLKNSYLILPMVQSIDESKLLKGPLARLEQNEMDEVLKKLVRIIS